MMSKTINVAGERSEQNGETPANKFFNKLEGVWENKLDGIWKDNWGWNVITQPEMNKLGMGGDFKIRIDQMKETITFRKLGTEPARNIGITGEAGFWHGMAYEVAIKSSGGDNDGEDIHHEMGHFLINVDSSGEARVPTTPNGNHLKGNIIRQATIPRANSFMTSGILQAGSLEKAVNLDESAFYNAKATTLDQDERKKIEKAFKIKNEEVKNSRGPDLTSPLDWMSKLPIGNAEGVDWVFSFRVNNHHAQMASGQRVSNPVQIGKLFSDFWIGDRKMSGKTVEVLQYAQRVNIRFNNIEWPHVAFNTLIKQSD